MVPKVPRISTLQTMPVPAMVEDINLRSPVTKSLAKSNNPNLQSTSVAPLILQQTKVYPTVSTQHMLERTV